MTDPNLRELTLDILYEILEQDGYSHRVLSAVLEKYQYLEKQQRAFITRVVQGTMERLITIDAVLDRFVKKPKVAKMKPLIRTLLRESVYQILYMDYVPDSAVCNEAVKLARKRGFSGLSGFVNGVLRNIAREKEQIRFEGWSETYAMPQWIIDQWLAVYPKEQVREMLEALLMEKTTCVRVNLRRITREDLSLRLQARGIGVEECPQLPYALYLSDYDHLTAVPEFREGLFYVQDFSSMKAVAEARIRPGDHVIDVCAAPGGKSLHAWELLEGNGVVEARDVSDQKVALLEENIRRSIGRTGDDGLPLADIRAEKRDATVWYEDSIDSADVVLCDAPCSGLGVIAGKPDIKYRMSPEKQETLSALQQQILSTVCHYVKPGGILLYSTCTIHRRENEDNVTRFLADHPKFVLEKQEQILPKAGRNDGFFYARMKRDENDRTEI